MTETYMHISYFKVEEFTIHSDHSQITTCLNLDISRQEDKLGRPPPVGLKWSKLTEKLFKEKNYFSRHRKAFTKLPTYN